MKKILIALSILVSITTAAFGGVADAIISVHPSNQHVTIGQTLSVNINVSSASDMFAYQMDLKFNPDILSATAVTESTFLRSGGTTAFLPGAIDNVGGTVSLNAASLIGALSGVTGGGPVVTVHFKAIGSGISPITISNPALVKSTLAALPANTANGSVIVAPPNPTTTTLNANPNPSIVGQNVTLTATVSQSAATGTVTFKDGAATLGTILLSSGTAILVVPGLAVGSHPLTAVYSGDATFATSTSPTVTEIVKMTTAITLTSSLNPANAGQNVILKATITPGAATGNITFMDGATVIGTAPISNPTFGAAILAVSTLSPGTHSLTAVYAGDAKDAGSASAILSETIQLAAKVAVFRNNTSFLEDSNGNGGYDPGVDRYIPSFTGPGGFVAGDQPVAGDWTGDGKTKVGIYRTSTGTWYLDANNNGVFDAGDLTFQFGGLPNDLAFVGDWGGVGRSCIGLFRQGFFWVLDTDCDGNFSASDATFPFGGIAGDVPVVGSWTGGATRVGVVRKYAPGGVPQGNPFYWVLDSGSATAGSAPANHQPDTARSFAFGGLAGDVFLTGDWYGTGTSGAAVYRAGYWVLDAALPGAPQASHVTGTAFGYGGVPGDVPLSGKW